MTEQGLTARRAGEDQLGQRAALYCRVSTADQSCERQERDLTAFAQRAVYEVVGIYKETGSGTRADRVERRKVIALAQRREIDAVLVTELSRWGRSTVDLLHTLEDLQAWRVSVIALNGLAFDLSTAAGRMMATVIAGVAQFERELIQERIRSGMAAAKARGRKLGRQPGSAAKVRPPRAEGDRHGRGREALLPDRRQAPRPEQEHRPRDHQAAPSSRYRPSRSVNLIRAGSVPPSGRALAYAPASPQ